MTWTMITFDVARAFWRRRRNDACHNLQNVIDRIRERRDSRLVRVDTELRERYQRMQEIAHEALRPLATISAA